MIHLISKVTFPSLLLLLLYFSSSSAQSLTNQSIYQIPKAITPIKIGEAIPEIVFKNVLNSSKKELRLADYKGKLIILDIWATTCGTCINSFPKMETLQSKFGDKIQIFLVDPYKNNYETQERIEKTISSFKKRTGINLTLPIPIQDTILNSLFPHTVIPHHIWIGEDLKVIAITGWDGTTEENIRSYLNKREISVPEKNDWSFDNSKPLVEDSNGGTLNDIIFRSTLTKRLNISAGGTSGYRFNSDKEIIGYYLINHNLTQLIRECYSEEIAKYTNSKVIFEVANLNSNNFYCYDITFPPSKSSENVSKLTRKMLRNDLLKYFGITQKKEYRNYELVIVEDGKYCDTSMYMSREIELRETSKFKYFHNTSISLILSIMKHSINGIIIEDRTKIPCNIDVDFIEPHQQLGIALIESLQKKGFKITKQKVRLEVLKITDTE